LAKPLSITRSEHTAEELRAAASRSRDGGQVRRLLALAFVLEGHSRSEAAELAGMDRQTPRDWVHRYNANGIEGLTSGHGPGKPPSLSKEQMAELKEAVLKGPDPAKHGVARWRCVDLRAEVARHFGVEVTERTIAKCLRKLALTRLQPRPFHPKKDQAAQETFKKLRQSGEGGSFGGHLPGRTTDRDLVPGRSQGGAKRWSCLYLGGEGFPSADGAR
jgi:transposase